MFKGNWLVFVVYRGYPNRKEIKYTTVCVNGVRKKKAEMLAVYELCFSKSDGIDFRSVLFAKPIKIRKWSR